ncbi:MAG: ABC-F family ATP-binding cassette domain-containing protein [Rhodobacteraceae bacterium]|nr:ABC-F family ATP-binding cassette domain-containing protein [Paracoccaceae bacterium]
MASSPLIQLNNISLTFGENSVFSNVNLVVNRADRIALVGRNGCGKSTLMKVLAGLLEADSGSRIMSPGTNLSYMEQDPDMRKFSTLGDYASSSLTSNETYKLEAFSNGLKLNLSSPVVSASGGEKRRASLAKLLAEEPEIMLLDEPTNHLDIEAIFWLEAELRRVKSAFIMISHDRAFLRALSKSTIWIDRGETRRQNKSFEAFEDWRDRLWEEEDLARHKLDQKIKTEARWAVEGISGRRKRNMGRVRALKALRSDRSSQIIRQDVASMVLEANTKSGKQTIVANKISKSFKSNQIITNFSLKVASGDKIAIVGPNGAGKTTLLNLLTGKIKPDKGTVKLGTNVLTAIFDQNREVLNLNSTLWESLTDSSETEVIGKGDFVNVRGTPKHVVGYLKDFLFSENQLRSPVSSLSGGEKARLVLARIMAKESNLLVLDEPTNDLDIETLDLLQELIAEYDGTVLLVSHDRDFIDRVATTTIAINKNEVVVYAGGWTDYLAQVGNQLASEESEQKKIVKVKNINNLKPKKERLEGLTFTQAHRLKALPENIEKIENEIIKLTELLSDPDLFLKDSKKFSKLSLCLVERQELLSELEDEWLNLEEKNSKGSDAKN